MNMSCSFSTSMKSNCSFSSVLKTNSSFSTVLKTHTYFIPLTPPFGSIFGGGEECPLPVLSQTRILAPPLSDRFCKKSEKIRIDSEWPNSARNRKKNFCPLVTPPRKKLRKIFKIFFQKFFESCSESSKTSRKLKISKKNFFQL